MVDREERLAALDRAAQRDGREDLGHQVRARAEHTRVGGRDDRDLRAVDGRLEAEPDRLRDVARVDVAPQVPAPDLRVVLPRGEARRSRTAP